MKYNKIYENSESAITSVVHKIISVSFIIFNIQKIIKNKNIKVVKVIKVSLFLIVFSVIGYHKMNKLY